MGKIQGFTVVMFYELDTLRRPESEEEKYYICSVCFDFFPRYRSHVNAFIAKSTFHAFLSLI